MVGPMIPSQSEKLMSSTNGPPTTALFHTTSAEPKPAMRANQSRQLLYPPYEPARKDKRSEYLYTIPAFSPAARPGKLFSVPSTVDVEARKNSPSTYPSASRGASGCSVSFLYAVMSNP